MILMKMMENDDRDNDVNESHINVGVSSGHQNLSWELGGRNQATSEVESTTTQENQKRRRWNKEENVELWKCYILSNPEQRGYRKRMTSLWHERANHQATEQRLADQLRAIQKKKWLTETEREEIKRKIEDPDIVQENEEHVEIPRVNEVNNLQPGNEEQHTLANKLREYAISVPNRLPSLKHCNSRLLKEKTREIDDILSTIKTNNITETNALMYAGAKLVTELMGKKTEINMVAQRRPIPPAKRRVMQQIQEMRKHLSWIEEATKGKLKNRNSKDTLERKYNLTEKGTAAVKEDLKQRIKAKSATIERFENRTKAFKQNKLFNTNQKRLYEQLRHGESEHSATPEPEPTKRYWENIWSNAVTHRKNAEWIQEVKNQERNKTRQQDINITVSKVKDQLKKVPNWKAPGPDCVQGYWLKNFKSLHGRIAQQLQGCITKQDVPEWMTTGRTALIQKDQEKGNEASNYRPITCLPVMWKLLTGIISEELYTYLEETNTLPKEQKGCRRKTRGTKDHLLVDKMIMKNCKRRKTNLSMAWIDYKKAFDMVPHSCITKCLKIYGAAENKLTIKCKLD